MPGYRIDELAQASGVTVRNIRYYQDRGMLPPPKREGRIGIYSEAHLVRLRLITRLLDRGYTAANITELVNAWVRGRDLSEILGFEQAVSGSLEDEVAVSMTSDEVDALFAGSPESAEAAESPERAAELLAKALDVAVIESGELHYRVPSPRLLHATAELVRVGAPLDGVLELIGHIRRSLDGAIREFIATWAEQLLSGHDPDWIPDSSELPNFAEILRQLKPLTSAAASAVLASSIARHLDEELGNYLERIMPSVGPDAPAT